MKLVNSQRAFASGARNPQRMARIRAEFQVLHTITATHREQHPRLTELEIIQVAKKEFRP